MSKLLAIQIMLLLWLMYQCNSISAQANVMGYSSLSSLELVMSIAAVGLQVAHSRVVYVTPNATSPCPKSDNSSCHTLSWYSHSDRERLLSNDTVVILLKGTHILNSTIHIENRKNLTIKGEDGYTLSFTDDRGQTPQPVTWINCTSSAETGIVFLNSTDIKIVNIGFDSCGTNAAFNSGAGEFNVSAALFFGMSYNVSIIQVIINNTYGSGLHMNCVFGNIWINDSILVRASKARNGRLGGNARLWFGQSSRCKNQCSTKMANLAIFRSSFMQGLNGSIGVEIIIDCPQVYVLMSNANIVNNTGGNIALSLTIFDGYAPTSSKVYIIHSIINGGRANTGGGIRVWSRHNRERESQSTYNNIVNSNNSHMHSALLTVHNTNFSFNSAIERGGAVYISHYQSYCIGYFCQVENVTILFKNCLFIKNLGNYGAAIETKQYLTSADYSLTVLSVSLDGCLFHGNSVQNNKSGPIINLIMTYMTISNSSFTDNNGSALTLLKSSLNFHGDISFENNHADYGAALRVCEASLIFLSNNTHISFTKNTAFFKGGAVYTRQSCVDTVPPCLFQPHLHENVSNESHVEALKLAIEFVNNSASIAGDAIYGGSLDHCFFIAKMQSDNMLPMLNMSGQMGPSWVSSDPQGVCFCDDNEQPSYNHKCRKEHPIIKVYPGAKFNISMITVGQMNGSTPGSIAATLDDSDKNGSDRLIVYRGRSANSSKCENMTFILQSKQKLINIHFDTVPSLTSTGPKTHVRSQSARLTVSLKPCPTGFFKNENHSCNCHPAFSAVDRVCDIDKQEISMHYHTWIGCLKNSSLQSCEFAFGHGCSYCTIKSTAVNVFDLDDRCLHGHTRVMCGACKARFSRILEQFRVPADCMKCSNTNLAFLIPLGLFSGIILVIFITIFNMTVTEGAINGLIFYSSVAYAQPRFFCTDQPAFFPWIFVSWLNLDLGFEICAYNGMTGYQYIWLSFGYIFCLIFTLIFIIYLSHKFISFTRLVRKNTTSVLATIIVLAYSRVIFVCYHSLNRKPVLVISNGSQVDKKYVWSFDGNIPYLGSKHIPLFILAIICLLVLLWFTFSLLMIQCLQKRSNIWCLRWVERLRPFFEAYTGPCNNNTRFWPGFLLLLRLGLFIVEIQEYNVTPVAGIFFLIISLACIFPHGVYKKWALNVLELLFVLNLGITFVVVQHTGNSHSDQIKTCTTGLVAQLSTSFALIMFFGILLYHIYRRIKGTPAWKKPTKLVSAGVKKLQVMKLRWSHKDDESDDEKALLLPQPLPPVLKFPEYREPLLED